MALPSHLLEAKKRMESKQDTEESKTESQPAPVEEQQQPEAQAQPEVQQPVAEQQSDEVLSLDVSEDDRQPEPQANANAEVEKWKKEADLNKARWETLQGKYRAQEAEIARLKSERTSVDAELNTLRSRIKELEQQQKQLNKKKIVEKIQESLSDEERALHGDTLPVISKVAEELHSRHEEEISSLRQEMEAQKKRDLENAHQTQVQAFHTAFRSAVPDAEKIAADPSWQSFVAKRDKLSGKLISEIWEEHVSRMNVNGLVQVIDAWRKMNSASKAPAPPKTPTLSAAAPQPRVSEQSRFKYSEFKQASEAYRQNIHNQDAKKKFEDAKRRFDEAKVRNLVDYAA